MGMVKARYLGKRENILERRGEEGTRGEGSGGAVRIYLRIL
jgi:hypothetical protein